MQWTYRKSLPGEGKLGAPIELDHLDIVTQMMAVRLAVEQADGKGGTKIRVIDDYRRNSANECAFWQFQTRNDSYDDVTSAVLATMDNGQQCEEVRVGVEDFKAAYKNIAPADSQDWLSWTMVHDPTTGRIKVCKILAMPFGACGSVLAWHRVATAIRSITRRILKLITLFYVDDIHLIARAQTADEDQRMLRDLIKAIGLTLEEEKAQGMCQNTRSLGCDLSIDKWHFTWEIPEEKVNKWSAER